MKQQTRRAKWRWPKPEILARSRLALSGPPRRTGPARGQRDIPRAHMSLPHYSGGREDCQHLSWNVSVLNNQRQLLYALMRLWGKREV